MARLTKLLLASAALSLGTAYAGDDSQNVRGMTGPSGTYAEQGTPSGAQSDTATPAQGSSSADQTSPKAGQNSTNPERSSAGTTQPDSGAYPEATMKHPSEKESDKPMNRAEAARTGVSAADFDKADTNHDGVLDARELKAWKDQQSK
jgi:hypothetical protein